MHFVQLSGSVVLIGMFIIQVVECIIYGRFFISANAVCVCTIPNYVALSNPCLQPLPVATLTIVMNLMFFGGPLLMFCCFVIGRSNFGLDEAEPEEQNGGNEGENDAENEHIDEEITDDNQEGNAQAEQGQVIHINFV